MSMTTVDYSTSYVLPHCHIATRPTDTYYSTVGVGYSATVVADSTDPAPLRLFDSKGVSRSQLIQSIRFVSGVQNKYRELLVKRKHGLVGH